MERSEVESKWPRSQVAVAAAAAKDSQASFTERSFRVYSIRGGGSGCRDVTRRL